MPGARSSARTRSEAQELGNGTLEQLIMGSKGLATPSAYFFYLKNPVVGK